VLFEDEQEAVSTQWVMPSRKRPHTESAQQAEHSCQPSGPKKACQPSSGFHGVRAQGKWWRVKIRYGGKRHHIGIFDTPQKAALAYDRAQQGRMVGTRQN
jgi:hypothetical protein